MIDEEEAKVMELEEQRIAEMERMLDEEDEDEDDEDEDEDEDDLNKSQVSRTLSGRPMSGKEARQQR